MRSVSGAFNRTVLAGCRFLIAAASSWVLASGLNAGRFWPDVASCLAMVRDRVSSLTAAQAYWLLSVAVLVSVLVVIAGSVLLAMQIPRKTAVFPLRFSDSEGVLMAIVAPEVLSQALSERAEDVPGVGQCVMWATGSPSGLRMQADATVSQDCGVAWVVAELRERFGDDVATSPGMRPRQVDVLAGLGRSASRRSVLQIVTGQHLPKTIGNDDGARNVE